ncbi:hypothetical protein Mal64_09080 [Pseudobythopirellula maris]|uniref:LamG-like jellyroll fold domain-containing protein n=2 Tax=Pseudobythopirellula maris TaxID=2527991 RepID=A0A5C5ZTX1_9BACT|nr:hypothetical protein Mal64_09080 [Pseudobythopirellula maris]
MASAGVPAALQPHLINHYTFDDPQGGDPGSATELDLGLDATPIQLLNGAPRVIDGAWGGSVYALETRQNNSGPNDDWKAGVFFDSSAESTLGGSNHVTGVTIAGWFKPLGDVGDNPSPNTNSGDPFDTFNAFGLAGLLRGDDGGVGVDGHGVRALLEVIGGKVVGLGRRLDDQSGSGRVSTVDDWHVVMPPGEWTHLTATFDFDQGEIFLYKNGLALAADQPQTDNWDLDPEETNHTSPTNPAGIKIGGSHPNNSQEQNPFNGRIDELTFFNRVVYPREVRGLYLGLSGQPGDYNGDGVVDAADFTVWRDTRDHSGDLRADGDNNGVVNELDYDLWLDNFGKSWPSPSSASQGQSTPEPSAGALLAVGVWGVTRKRRKP